MTDTPTFDAVARDTLPGRVDTPTYDPPPTPVGLDTPAYDPQPVRVDTPTYDALAHTRDAHQRGVAQCPEQRDGTDPLGMDPVTGGRHRKASPFAAVSPWASA
jgi:hypothetical protein